MYGILLDLREVSRYNFTQKVVLGGYVHEVI